MIGAAVDESLGIFKVEIGLIIWRVARFADGVNSLSDLCIDVPVILAARWSLMQTMLMVTTGFRRCDIDPREYFVGGRDAPSRYTSI